MEKYCKSCGRVFDDLNFKLCPYCGSELTTRYGRQPIPRKLRHEVFKRDGYRCRECGASKDETSLEIDHIVPVACGGTNDIDNLQTLCRECNRMKHTDEWVGGETDLETVKSELDSLNNQIRNAKFGLKQATTEDDIIEYKYQIMILEKRLSDVKNRYDKLYNENKQFEAKREKEEKKKKLYKKLYVEIDEVAYKKWSIDNLVPYNSKEEFIDYASNLSERNVNKYIYTIGLYKELLDNPKKLSTYEKLYTELDDESIDILSEIFSQNSNKGQLILDALNKYCEIEIKNIINKRKKAIKIEKKRKQAKINIEKRERDEFKKKAKEFAIKEYDVLEEYKKYLSLSKAADVTGCNAEEVCMWYFAGKNGDPLHYDFYIKVNRIKEPTTKLDLKNMPPSGSKYCNKCHNVIGPAFIFCPYCNHEL